jgi:quercetin dioxygenase-like cupin family protein
MSDASCFHNLRAGGIPRVLAGGLRARIFPGQNLMLSVVEITPGSVSPVHSHPQEQWGVCLEGEWIRIQDGVEHHVRAGDFWQTPPHVPHGGRALPDRGALVLDIFSPPRDEYRQPSGG